jgi:hypothetical protein
MKSDRGSTEREFCDLIDGRFPFSDMGRSLELIGCGCSISPEAAYCLMHELVRGGLEFPATLNLRRDLLSRLEASFQHPLKAMVLTHARAILARREVPVDEVMGAFRALSPYVGLWSALSILYFSGPLGNSVIEDEDRRIREKWGAVLGGGD